MDNNSNKTTNGNNPVIIIGGPASGKTTMVKKMMSKYFITEVHYCFANPLQLDQGILPEKLVTGPFPVKMIVVEGITNLFQAISIIVAVKVRYEEAELSLPKIFFTCQNENWLDMKNLHLGNISVIRLADNPKVRRAVR